MTEVVIVQDVTGHPLRVQALQDAHERVIAVSLPECHQRHARPFRVPGNWLSADTSVPFTKRCWVRAAWVGLAAVRDLAVDADAYWFIESDCVASQERWKALFADQRGNPADCVSNPIRERAATLQNPWWSHRGTPDWASCFFVPACFRLSRRAVLEAIRCAEETRECFSEIALPSVLRRAGMTMESANRRKTHWNAQTFKTVPEKVIVNPLLLNHPVKVDSYGPT
ncbi:hypothetical protein OKA04_12255 [Luteolibacter flavescens]|uniref:Glycosyltransferase n=1 Tax=Luteolibacter flavescens TaxID=1859460 RepID=A0ABT3FPK5_9BACT|nr:hypothetical protein [Luteolibacter flavescens]MCW1885503.1 hypothetical protein [Luteolibacter flavescens]